MIFSSSEKKPPVLTVEDLTVTVGVSGPAVVRNLDFHIDQGGILALVGESGSGKTMAARSIIDVLPRPLTIESGSRVLLGTSDLTKMSTRELRQVRGSQIGMVFQEPMVSLNPSMRIGEQMAEGLRLHRNMSESDIRDCSVAMLDRIRIRDPLKCLNAFPHEFSGGMRQRIMLASVMLLKPQLLIADEPTTALDTLVQRDVLDLMVELSEENGAAVLLISHDLGMVSHYARDIIVMREGVAIESGNSREVLLNPKHAYTRDLVDALPRRGPACNSNANLKPLLEISELDIGYAAASKLLAKRSFTRVVHKAALTVHEGETLALVGASGSGKTTLGRAVVGLERPEAGTVTFDGELLSSAKHRPTRAQRASVQMIFQDPYSSLDPRHRVGQIVEEPLLHDRGLGKAERLERVCETLEAVGLNGSFLRRLPHQLSGGQRQRLAIARAMVRRPRFVVADEPISALDMTVQRQILQLITSLQKRYGFACLFISHDLAAVGQVADRIAVMQNGRIVEQGSRDDILDRPQHDYTRDLLAASMGIEAVQSMEAGGRVPT